MDNSDSTSKDPAINAAEAGTFKFTDENITVHTGEDAKKLLAEKSDAQFLSTTGKGVLKIPEVRWQEAQRCEEKHQMVRKKRDDNNCERFRGFDEYSILAGRHFSHAIELGCGPFTNLRLIADVCDIESCTLLDPLIPKYLNHPNCCYDEHRLKISYSKYAKYSYPKNRILRKLRKLREKSMDSLRLHRKIPIRKLFSCPIEEMPPEGQPCDLVVMINVLEHCFDIEAILQKILELLPIEGILIFGDILFDEQHLQAWLPHAYDAAHPLRVSEEVIRQFLADHFQMLYSQEKLIVRDNNFRCKSLCYIGKKIS